MSDSSPQPICLSVRARLALAFLCVLVPYLALVGVVVVCMPSVWQALRIIRQEATVDFKTVADLRFALAQISMPVRDYLITGDPGERDRFERRAAGVDRILTHLEADATFDTEERRTLEELRRQISRIEAISREILAGSFRRGDIAASEKMRALDDLSGTAAEAVGRLFDVEFREVEDEIQRIIGKMWPIRAVAFAALGLGLVGGAVSVFLLSVWLTRPVRAIAEASRKMAGGDLSPRLTVTGGELGETARAFNEMADRLQASVEALGRRNEELEATTKEAESHRLKAEALAEMGRLLTQSLDLDEVAQRIADNVKRMFSAEGAILCRLDPASGDLVVLARSGELLADLAWGSVIKAGMGGVGLAVNRRRVVATENVLTDPEIVPTPKMMARIGRSVLAAPLIIVDRVIGAISAASEAGRIFDDEEIRLAQAFADQAALAIENARLYTEAKESRDFLQSIAENSMDAIVTTDLQGRITYFSPGATRILGYSAQDVLHRPVADYYRGGIDEARAVMRRLWAEGRIQEYETAFQRRDGRWVSTSFSISLLRDAEGTAIGTVGVGRDMTERRRTEAWRVVQFRVTRALAESATLAEAVSKLLQVICEELGWDLGEMWLLDTDANVLRWSASWSVTPEVGGEFEALSRDLTFAFEYGLPGRTWASARPLWVSDVLSDPEFLRASPAAGASLHTAFTFPIGSEGDITGVMVFFSRQVLPPNAGLLDTVGDIGRQIGQFTQRKRTEDILRETEARFRQIQKMEAVGRLAAGVAHDFNNLLTVIGGRAELLRDRFGPVEDLELVRQTAKRATILVRQLLAFGRRQALQPRVLRLNAVIREMEPLLRRVIREDVEWISILDPAAGYVKADPSQLEQVLLNLAVNARDAMAEGGRLTIETASVVIDEAMASRLVDVSPGPHVMLKVSDTGCGMDAETVSQIFEPFFTTKEAGRGTGLGLSSVYGIVRQSGGHIEVQSAPGAGTTFSIYFPQARDVPEVIEPKPGRTILPRGSETILLVEDEEEVRELARDVLELQGYTVLYAASGAEALIICERHGGPIHLLLTDVVMPGMSGRQLAERAVTLRPEMKVLYMSGYPTDVLAPQGVIIPGTALLEKPFVLEHLARKVREVLDAAGSD